VLLSLGGLYVRHAIAHASNTYGFFAIVIALLSWIYLAAQVTMYVAEANVVMARRRGENVLRRPTEGEGRPVRSFLMLDPPDHTRLRRLVSRSFTPRRVEELAPRIEAITDGLLGAVSGRRSFDAVAALASPLPVAVISELFGVSDADRGRLVRWSHALASGIEPSFLVPEEERRTQATARGEFAEYLAGEIARRRRAPRDYLVSDLVALHDRGESLTEPEIVATCVLLLVAGHETTTNLIGNGLYALLQNPGQLDELALLVECKREETLMLGFKLGTRLIQELVG
jgi:cytochrome P450